jgi:CHAT domain-containing protein
MMSGSMSPTEFAAQLSNADESQRATLFASYTELLTVELAYALKEQYDALKTNEPEQAINATKVLTEMALQLENQEIHAVAAWVAGMASLHLEGKMDDSLKQLDQAVTLFKALNQPRIAASVQISRLHALAMLGRYEEAVKTGKAARDVFVTEGDQLAAGKIEINLGSIYWRRDRYQEAEKYYSEAKKRLNAEYHVPELVTVDFNLANVLAWQHRFAEAVTRYHDALQRAEAAGLTVRQAEIEGNLGNMFLFQGNYREALEYLERSRRRYLTLNMPHELAYAEQELAEVYLELNMAAEAAAIYSQVTPKFAELKMREEQAWALAHLGQANMLQSQYAEARKHFSEAHALFADEKNQVKAALVTLFEAQLFYQQSEFAAVEQAITQIQPVLDGAQQWGRALLARWLHGEALRSLGHMEEAQTVLKAAQRDADHYLLPQIAQRCYTSLGKLAATNGAIAQAEIAFNQALDIIEQLRAPLPAEEFRTAFVADKLSPYTELARLCLEAEPPRPADALNYIERARSRALLEMLAGSSGHLTRPRDAFEEEAFGEMQQLRERLNWLYSQMNRAFENAEQRTERFAQLQKDAHDCEDHILTLNRQLQQHGSSTWSRVEPLNLEQLQADLGTDTVLIEYYSLDEQLLAFVVTSETVSVMRLPATEALVNEAVQQFRFQTDAMRRGAGRMQNHLNQLLRRAQHYLTELYHMLLAPLEDQLGQRRLVIVPHRTLHYVPFRALYNGSQYVIEQREVCTVPSAGVLHHCLTRPTTALQSALLLGVPDERAPRVRDEVEALVHLFPQAVALLDQEANTSNLRQQAPGVDVLHLACHGQFRPDNPLFSALRLSDAPFTTRDAYGLELNCDLVVLSACETGVSAIAPGDELIGLARGFFAAGAPTLIVSLWAVDDTTTATMMTTFYRHFQAGVRPAAALRLAQRELMETHPHPFYWAPFVVLGRW